MNDAQSPSLNIEDVDLETEDTSSDLPLETEDEIATDSTEDVEDSTAQAPFIKSRDQHNKERQANKWAKLESRHSKLADAYYTDLVNKANDDPNYLIAKEQEWANDPDSFKEFSTWHKTKTKEKIGWDSFNDYQRWKETMMKGGTTPPVTKDIKTEAVEVYQDLRNEERLKEQFPTLTDSEIRRYKSWASDMVEDGEFPTKYDAMKSLAERFHTDVESVKQTAELAGRAAAMQEQVAVGAQPGSGNTGKKIGFYEALKRKGYTSDQIQDIRKHIAQREKEKGKESSKYLKQTYLLSNP